MLKNIPPILGPELLQVLRAMGHGDELVIADANFPAASHAARLVRLDGHAATDVLDAVLTLLPLDEFVDCPAHRMAVVGDAEAVPDICNQFQAIIDRHESPAVRLGQLERFAFYQRARDAYAIVATGEQRLYGNVILTKGIIRPE